MAANIRLTVCLGLLALVTFGCRKPPVIERAEDTTPSTNTPRPEAPGTGEPSTIVTSPNSQQPTPALPHLDPDVGLRDARSAFNEKDYKKSIEILDRAIYTANHDGKLRLPEDVAPLYWLRGSANLKIALHQKAVVDLEQAIKLQPKNFSYLNGAARVLATSQDDKIRDGKTAVEHAEKAVKLIKGDNAEVGLLEAVLVVPLYDTLATALAETGDFEGALRAQQNAIKYWHEVPAGADVLSMVFNTIARWRLELETQRVGKRPTQEFIDLTRNQIEEEIATWHRLPSGMNARKELYSHKKPCREK